VIARPKEGEEEETQGSFSATRLAPVACCKYDERERPPVLLEYWQGWKTGSGIDKFTSIGAGMQDAIGSILISDELGHPARTRADAATELPREDWKASSVANPACGTHCSSVPVLGTSADETNLVCFRNGSFVLKLVVWEVEPLCAADEEQASLKFSPVFGGRNP